MRFRDPQAAELAVLEACDNFAPLRNGLRHLAHQRNEWAGIPMPLDGMPLVIEPNYPKAKELMAIGVKKPDPATAADDDGRIINRFWSWKWRSDIVIFEQNGKRDWGKIPGVHHFSHDLQTLGASEAWGIEQEQRALKLLGTMLRHRQFKQYLLTGMFLERSKRSGVTYMFRRLKPTVAITTKTKDNHPRILATLCLHPIGFYEDSWAGAMTPSDDVVAHLALMRGDEVMFWRRSNQCPAYRPEAGL